MLGPPELIAPLRKPRKGKKKKKNKKATGREGVAPSEAAREGGSDVSDAWRLVQDGGAHGDMERR
jgi:hypothetical protein